LKYTGIRFFLREFQTRVYRSILGSLVVTIRTVRFVTKLHIFLFLHPTVLHDEVKCKMQGASYIHNKGKAVPLQARRGPEGSKNLRFPDFVTTAQDGGKVVSLTHRPPLPTRNTPGTLFC